MHAGWCTAGQYSAPPSFHNWMAVKLLHTPLHATYMHISKSPRCAQENTTHVGWCTAGQYSAAPSFANWVADARRLGVDDVYVYHAVLGEDSAEAAASMANSSSAARNVSTLAPFETVPLPGGARFQWVTGTRR